VSELLATREDGTQTHDRSPRRAHSPRTGWSRAAYRPGTHHHARRANGCWCWL